MAASVLGAAQGCDVALPVDNDAGPIGDVEAGASTGPACTPRECGPAPGAPNYVCADGSLGGPGACQRDAQGGCGYVWHTCADAGSSPATTPDASAAPDAATGPDASSADAGPAADASAAPDASSARCGTRGGVQCSDDQFCSFEPAAQCGTFDSGGHCESRPQVCTALYKPVCGCDNRSYSLDCHAHGAGVSVKHDGLCTPAECTMTGGKPKYSSGADVPSCAAGEEQWNLSGGIEPVICCLPTGKPAGQGPSCGGIAGLACAAGSFCNYEPEAGGQGCQGIADAAGVCQSTPQVCTLEYAPVCGCDQRTYATRCAAHAAGVSVLRSGACTELDCAAIGGKPVDGIGPAPVCARGDVSHGEIVYSSGAIADEGTICCVPQ